MPKHRFVSPYGSMFEIPYEKLLGINDSLSTEANKYSKKNIERIKRTYEYELALYRDLGPERGYHKPKRPMIPTKAERRAAKEKYKNADPNIVATDKQKIEYRNWKHKNDEIRKQLEENTFNTKLRLEKYEHDMAIWKEECLRLNSTYEALKKKYEESLAEFPMVFRYFKQATFSSYPWNFEIDHRSLSVLYLSYILFLLERRFGQDFSIQIGVPSSKDTFSRYESYASAILIQAYRIVEDVFENDFDKFLSTPYEELLNLIPKHEYSDELKFNYGIIVLPEAYAALRSLSAHGRIANGFGIMLDIGGGTSDLVFYNQVAEGELRIYYYISIPKGLNFFLEYEERKSSSVIDLSVKRDFKSLKMDILLEADEEYTQSVKQEVAALVKFYIKDIQSRKKSKSYFLSRIKNAPIIYTGGGSVYTGLRKEIFEFSDVRYLDKRLLNIHNDINARKIDIPYSLLATAYGLSNQIKEEEKEILVPKEDLFAEFGKKSMYRSQVEDHEEYGLSDT